ncbi:hypothetical protein KHA80_07840 [Anaerobacillus sp. HL2]|nr:hypothetical protein KHA80_07840 [Anaerobacillus sp. HL2]
MYFDKETDFGRGCNKSFDRMWLGVRSNSASFGKKDLLKNWADILFNNNRQKDRLNECPLTDGEMQQIMEQIKLLQSPIKLNGFINGKSVSIKRDNSLIKNTLVKRLV